MSNALVADMTLTDWLAIIAIFISVGSLLIARRAKKQAQKAATLSDRGRAIDHLHAAVAGLKRGTPLSADVRESVQKAKGIADRVFIGGVRDQLDEMLKTIRSLELYPNDARAWGKPIAELESLIARMNEEADLSR
jgi:hypothetical protein